jgi:hypothetical protein
MFNFKFNVMKIFKGTYVSKSTGEEKPALFVRNNDGVDTFLSHGYETFEDAVEAIKADKPGHLSRIQFLNGQYGTYATFAASPLEEL